MQTHSVGKSKTDTGETNSIRDITE